MNLGNHKVENATHLLNCCHSYNSKSKLHYTMPCLVLKTMPNNRSKIVVFGDRFYKNTEGVKRVRYVDNNKLTIQRDVTHPRERKEII